MHRRCLCDVLELQFAERLYTDVSNTCRLGDPVGPQHLARCRVRRQTRGEVAGLAEVVTAALPCRPVVHACASDEELITLSTRREDALRKPNTGEGIGCG